MIDDTFDPAEQVPKQMFWCFPSNFVLIKAVCGCQEKLIHAAVTSRYQFHIIITVATIVFRLILAKFRPKKY